MARGKAANVQDPVLGERVAAVRRFNRLYTRRIGLLGEKLLDSEFTLSEVRILYEVANRFEPTAAELARDLGIHPTQLSRSVRRLERRELLDRDEGMDGRTWPLGLTSKGQRAFATLDQRSNEEVAKMLSALSARDQSRLVGAMAMIERVLEARPAAPSGYLLRAPEAGDFGWVVQRHGALYAEEYGWNEKFEGLVAGVVAKFVESRDDERERCWIAERDGEPAGCVFLVQQSKSVAKLRLLLVEPSARNQGIGERLVAECIRFARRARYRHLQLWTNDVLVSARRIYEAAGFVLQKEERHRRFGPELTGQVWQLDL